MRRYALDPGRSTATDRGVTVRLPLETLNLLRQTALRLSLEVGETVSVAGVVRHVLLRWADDQPKGPHASLPRKRRASFATGSRGR